MVVIGSSSDYRDTPIVVISANVFAEDKKRYLEVGMNDLIIEPVEPNQIFATFLRWLEQNPV